MQTIAVVAGIMEKDGLIFASQRAKGSHQALKWEFPGGKIEEGETPEAALERELFEELGIITRTGGRFYEVEHEYPDKRVRVTFYKTSILSGTPAALEANAVGWFTGEKLLSLDFAAADRHVAEMLSGAADSDAENDISDA